MKRISIFNHKGGVGKTTLTYNLSYALESKGKKVLLIDADAQCNLTSIALSDADLQNVYQNGGYSLKDALGQLLSGAGDIQIGDPITLTTNISLIPGHIEITDYESQLNTAWNECFTGLERGFRTHSAIHRLSEQIGRSLNVDYIIYDLGPNVGPLNRSLILSSDHFVVPVVPDQFSLMAIGSVGKSISKWYTDWQTAKQRVPANLTFNIQNGEPKFIGYISQQFNISRGRPTQAFEHWEQQIPNEIQTKMINVLPNNLIIDGVTNDLPSVKNYHSLVPAAQTNNKPIFNLNPPEINAGHMGKVRDCRADFESLAEEIINRT
ncbi:ParA family protein [Leptobacterium sp. I13]|uniref:ParA family protein n=1 Tax=Leptobacterium meishanense TaxID=3128904 RepID=UPI0030EDF37C